MVVAVADPGLVAGHRVGRLDATYEPGAGQGAQDVVDRLVRDVADRAAGGLDEDVGLRVRVGVHGGQDGQSGTRHSESRVAQGLLEQCVGRHTTTVPHFLE